MSRSHYEPCNITDFGSYTGRDIGVGLHALVRRCCIYPDRRSQELLLVPSITVSRLLKRNSSYCFGSSWHWFKGLFRSIVPIHMVPSMPILI